MTNVDHVDHEARAESHGPEPHFVFVPGQLLHGGANLPAPFYHSMSPKPDLVVFQQLVESQADSNSFTCDTPSHRQENNYQTLSLRQLATIFMPSVP